MLAFEAADLLFKIVLQVLREFQSLTPFVQDSLRTFLLEYFKMDFRHHRKGFDFHENFQIILSHSLVILLLLSSDAKYEKRCELVFFYLHHFQGQKQTYLYCQVI